MTGPMPAPPTSLRYGRLAPEDWRSYRAVRLAALLDAPDAFGSTWAAEQDRQPAQWQARLTAAHSSGRDLPLVAMADARAVGLLWAKVDADDTRVVHLFQMWVAPEMRGQGVGKRLLAQAIAWARSVHAQFVQLGVTCADTPALRLYRAAGFQAVGAPALLREGSALQAQTMRLLLQGKDGLASGGPGPLDTFPP